MPSFVVGLARRRALDARTISRFPDCFCKRVKCIRKSTSCAIKSMSFVKYTKGRERSENRNHSWLRLAVLRSPASCKAIKHHRANQRRHSKKRKEQTSRYAEFLTRVSIFGTDGLLSTSSCCLRPGWPGVSSYAMQLHCEMPVKRRAQPWSTVPRGWRPRWKNHARA